MTRDEQIKAVERWLAPAEDSYRLATTDSNAATALYTLTELGVLDECLSGLNIETATRVWALMETLRIKKFPDRLRI